MNEYCNIEIQKLASSAASGRYLLGYNNMMYVKYMTFCFISQNYKKVTLN